MSKPIRQHNAPVLIVGAGSSGLSTALQLQRAGVDFVIIDAAETPCAESRAGGMQPRTLELLDLHEVSDELIAGGGRRVKAFTNFLDGVEVGRIEFPPSGESRFHNPPTMRQADIEATLRRRLASNGTEVQMRHRLVSIEQNEKDIVARIETPDGSIDFTTDWLIGTDGARSTVRKITGLEFEGMSYPETMGLMDAELEWDMPPDELRVYRLAGSTQQFVIVPFRDKTYRIQITDRPDELVNTPPTVEEMQELFDRFTGLNGVISNPIWTSAFNVHRRQAATYRSGRALLAGDAAHIHTPAGAQGLNTGIQDGINLGWKLAMVVKGEADASFIDTYEEERRPIAKDVLELADNMTNRPMSLLGPGGKTPPALTKRLAQLAVTYRDGPMGQPARIDDLPTAGDRLPDIEVDGGSIYRKLRPGNLVIALFGDITDPAQSGEEFAAFLADIDIWRCSADHPLAQALGIGQGAVVIRPDAYLGRIIEAPVPQAVADVADWLRSVLTLKTAA
ncbi:FAD-dependent oxidoreductase [Sphingobium sp.]|uniref:FAD-dependent oxidoreductase n=1 Tax=Sphingobium sp. TaxID=1912891 RepID=UPI0028BE17FC|nr:FAD-dependent oxidoreductase [Sphingobium sp.]